VELRFDPDRPDVVTEARVIQQDWLPGDDGIEVPVTLRREWTVQMRVLNRDAVLLDNTQPMVIRNEECVEEVWKCSRPDGSKSEDDVLLQTIPWGVPHLPWGLIRGGKKSLQATRGESAITPQAMKTADRYNANEQVSWLIGRYNSHANLAVTGDSALLMQQKSERLHKDIADVLLFPGGTDLHVLQLSTDSQMIEHQKKVLNEALYGCMGLAQHDQDSLTGLNGVSGYALEILQEKTGLTFNQVRDQMIVDWDRLLNLILDCSAYWMVTGSAAEFSPVIAADLLGVDDSPQAQQARFEAIDPALTFADRGFVITMGSGYIVDDVKVRDDFTAKLISQEEALRLRGYGKEEIKAIMEEQTAQADAAQQRQMDLFAAQGTGTEGTQRPTGTSAGKTTAGSTARRGA
jgi:predicted nucleic acid-binding protein